MRVAQEEALGRPQPGPRQRLGDPRLLVTAQPVDPQPLGDGLVDRVPRVQRAGRVLQHELDPAPVGLERPARRSAAARRRSSTCPDAGPLQPEQRAGQRGLAAARLADQRDDLARPTSRSTPSTARAGRPAAAAERRRSATTASSGRAAGVIGATSALGDAHVHAGGLRGPARPAAAAARPRSGSGPPPPGSAGGTGSPAGRSPGHGGSPGSPRGAKRDAGRRSSGTPPTAPRV